ncbi:MAG: hypothetical protein IKC46_03260 [Lachnospiraceae bacterium]|nr:hypothetical protein [Lachnospiraceae bacterium]
MRIVLDPQLIWFDKKDEEHEFLYLREVVDFIHKYLDINYLLTDQFLQLLYMMAKDPMGEYRESSEVKNDIISKIWKSLDGLDDVIYLEDIEELQIPDSFKTVKRDDIKKYTNNIWKLMSDGNQEILFFLGRQNHNWAIVIKEKLHFVKHVYRELNSYLGELFSEGEVIKQESVIKPTKINPLPNAELCKEYSEIRVAFIENGEGTISNFKSLGREVAYRNGYQFNAGLTRINNSAIREIYSLGSESKIHLSIDIEHGAVEVCDADGHHMGEFSYEGKLLDGPKQNHDIKVHR